VHLMVLRILVADITLHCRVRHIVERPVSSRFHHRLEAASKLSSQLQIIRVGKTLLLLIVVAGGVEWTAALGADGGGIGIALHTCDFVYTYYELRISIELAYSSGFRSYCRYWALMECACEGDFMSPTSRGRGQHVLSVLLEMTRPC
jgi:hypothetical protein